ncbi:hypothetical protein CASFOL_029958 [Castilleja foliolosa]|uniref:Fe2OG dioxygenase domain-containing protein n=1 Tax=Castilleja foliolosa TaxID=1961234 RepID=A0ABD3CAR9_9LAMI
MADNFDEQQYDAAERVEMLRAFDETNAGVKGLIDSGLQKVPKIFVRPSDELAQELTYQKTQIQVPVIDLSEIQTPVGRKRIVEEVKVASETWGFFQVVNHGISTSVLDGMIDGVRKFNDQDVEEKKKYYTRDIKRRVRFSSSYDLFTSRTASWRDTLSISFPGPDPTDIHELPASCRESTLEYSKHVEILGNILLGLLSEALGLESDHLKNMEFCKGHRIHGHYYPACPEPRLAIGINKHSDPGFLTILLQSQGICSLQVLHQGQWVDIQPTPGGLVINIGDLLQLVSNGIFRSNEHRAISNHIGPRISVVCFFSGPLHINWAKTYGPIKELLSEENPPIYKDVILGEYLSKFLATGLDNYRALDYYKVESTVEYSKHVEILGNNLLGLLSEALGLETDHLKNMDCSKEHRLHTHYYPVCPEPKLAIGLHKHSDPGFLTILLQSQGINALQVLYQSQWVDIKPTPGGLVVNIGDLLQLVSNGKFKSNKHRAIVSNIGARISVACFFSGPLYEAKNIYGPINELIFEESPPIYKDVVLGEYISRVATTGLDNYHALDYYKV